MDRATAIFKRPPFKIKISNKCNDVSNWADCFDQAGFCRVGRDSSNSYYKGKQIFGEPRYSPVGTVFIVESLKDTGDIFIKTGKSSYKMARNGQVRAVPPAGFTTLLVPPDECGNLKRKR